MICNFGLLLALLIVQASLVGSELKHYSHYCLSQVLFGQVPSWGTPTLCVSFKRITAHFNTKRDTEDEARAQAIRMPNERRPPTHPDELGEPSMAGPTHSETEINHTGRSEHTNP